jgi:hypothetical protein
MERLEYESPKPWARARSWGQRIWLAVKILVGAPVAIVVLFIAAAILGNWQFEYRTRESRLLGLTPAQISSLIGPPDPFYTSHAGGALVYRAWTGDGCRIDIENGIAVRVVRLHH